MKKQMTCSECQWSGDISETTRKSDRGWIDVVWWWVAWYCPKCKNRIEEINHNTALNHPLQSHCLT